MSSILPYAMNTITLPYNSNDAHIWTDKDPDLELIEPRILVSINRNYLVYGRKLGRPPQNHPVILVNHGENPVAFKVLTTDNYAYFVNHVSAHCSRRIFLNRNYNLCGSINDELAGKAHTFLLLGRFLI
ncbi:hypothetical protein OSTOST_15469, partial [Ostertagia ostertagi]